MFRTMLRAQIVLDASIAALATLFVVVLAQPGAVDLAVAIGFGVALAVRRLSPGLALGLAWCAAVAEMLWGRPPTASDLLVAGVLYAAGAYGGPRVRWAGFASAIAGPIVGSAFITVRSYASRSTADLSAAAERTQFTYEIRQLVGLFVVILALLLLPWLAGFIVRTRGAARISREAQLVAERDAARFDRAVAVEQERVRIARDMHDIVAHSLAVVIAQADGARYSLRAFPENADDALVAIGSTARRALADVRELLGALRHEREGESSPDVEDIDRIVAGMQELGADIRLTREGDATALPTTSQLAVYRVVQEALTNAFKHGVAGAPIQASLRYGPRSAEINVANDVAGDGTSGPGTGHGLVGMRERVELSGGTMSAVPSGTRFVVQVRIPVHPAEARMPHDATTSPAASTAQEQSV